MTATPPTSPMPALEGAVTALSTTIATGTTSIQAEPGYTTTEFWVTATTEVIGLLASAGVIGSSLAEKLTGIAGMVVAGAFYAVSRGLRKQGTA